MSELREAAQAALKVMMEHRTQILLINEVEGRIYYNTIDRLRAALAQPEQTKEEVLAAVIRQLDEMQQRRIEREERLGLAQPEAEAQPVVEPVAWESRWIDPEEGPSDWVPTRNPDFYRSRPNYEVRPLYAHQPRDEWRLASEPPGSTRSVLIWLKFGDVETFGKTLGGPSGFAFQNGAITHWRDVTPPTEGE